MDSKTLFLCFQHIHRGVNDFETCVTCFLLHTYHNSKSLKNITISEKYIYIYKYNWEVKYKSLDSK